MSDSKKCNHPVEEQFELGKLLGINGTPTILLEDGRLIAGYLAPNQLLKILEE